MRPGGGSLPPSPPRPARKVSPRKEEPAPLVRLSDEDIDRIADRVALALERLAKAE